MRIGMAWVLVLAGCAQGHVLEDAGAAMDAQRPIDASRPMDAAPPVDAGPRDAGAAMDAQLAMDAAADGGPLDAGMDAFVAPDAGCGVGRALCGGSCVEVTMNVAHCGACDVACAAGESCVAGVCTPPPATWSTRANDVSCTSPGVLGSRRSFTCPPGGSAGSVWGTGEYTHDSSVCTAAVHAGRITFAAGGAITIEMRAGRSSYVGSSRNGVTSSSYGTWSCSFAVVGPACPSSAADDCDDLCIDTTSDEANCGACGIVCPTGRMCSAGSCGCGPGETACGGACVDTTSDEANCGACGTTCASGELCVAGACGARAITWSTSASDHDCSMAGVIGSRFRYACPASGVAASAWGTDVYTHDSSICTAAVHAGRITLASGGNVTIEMAPGQSSYPGSTRNGITTSTWGSW